MTSLIEFQERAGFVSGEFKLLSPGNAGILAGSLEELLQKVLEPPLSRSVLVAGRRSEENGLAERGPAGMPAVPGLAALPGLPGTVKQGIERAN